MTDYVHAALAALLTSPTKRLRDVVQSVCAAEDDRTRSEVVSQAREAMKKVAWTSVRQSERRDEPLPLLVDRLSFAWSLLRQADGQIRRTVLPKPPKTDSPTGKVINADEFHRGLLIADLSDNLLGNPLGAPLQAALLELLGVDERGQFLLLYHTFLKANTPKKLGINVVQADGTLSDRNTRRLIRWIIRKLNMKYVDVVDGAMVTHVPFLMEETLRQFYEWSGLRKEACDSGRIKDLVAEEISTWLAYSCLDGDSLPESAADQAALIKVFQKDNKLTDRVHSAPPQADPIKDRRIADLEAELVKAHDEIRTLSTHTTSAQPPASVGSHEVASGRDDTTAQAVRDVCKAIESKYPLDKLSDAQHSDDPMLSLKSVVSHLFFVLRRQGLTSYPTEDAFDLSYEKAGLFECLGFEVPPGELREVEVVQRGWAIKAGDRLLPIRRAQVRIAEDQ